MLTKKAGKISYLTGSWPLRDELPTIIFLHSAGCKAEAWQKQMEGLAESANTIAVDLPGHGGSTGPALVDVPAMAATVAEFMREIKVNQPILCGLSMGSAVTLQFLLDYPEMAGAGIVIGTGARMRVAPMIFEAIAKDYAGFVNLMSKLAFAASASDNVVQEVSELMLSCNPAVTVADFQACNSYDVMERISKINQPVLIISGAEDKMTPSKYADYLEQHLAKATRCHLPATGHMIPHEKPLEVNQAIRDFITHNLT